MIALYSFLAEGLALAAQALAAIGLAAIVVAALWFSGPSTPP